MIRFRPARREDVPAVVALLAEDALGTGQADCDLDCYLAAFERMQAEGGNLLIVGEDAGHIVATYQMTIIIGLSLRATRRAQVESLRVAAAWRRQGRGTLLMADAEARARAAGCSLIQLTSNAERLRTRQFYERLGYNPSHIGFKRELR